MSRRGPLSLALLLSSVAACEVDRDSGLPVEVAEGELVYAQVALGASALGEAALIVGPDGTSVLVDTGNDSHADDVRGAMARHGLDGAVDWVVLTHYHADHIGGFDALDLDIRQGLVWRGPSVADGVNRSELDGVLAWAEDHQDQRVDLCTGDADCQLPWSLDLGGGASLGVVAVGACSVSGTGVADLSGVLDAGDGDDMENARSLVAVLDRGDFELVLAGDLTGGGSDTPAMEAAAVAAAGELLPAVDVLKLAHHGKDTSTGEAWLDHVLPGEADRHALVSANGLYVGAPSGDVLERLAPHLGGGTAWLTHAGALAGDHACLVEAGEDILVRVAPGGASYRIGPRSTHADHPTWQSTP